MTYDVFLLTKSSPYLTNSSPLALPSVEFLSRIITIYNQNKSWSSKGIKPEVYRLQKNRKESIVQDFGKKQKTLQRTYK